MRSVAGWPAVTGLVSPTVQVLLNGAPVECGGVTLEREIPSPTPGQVSSVGGVVAATGNVNWAQKDTVTGRVSTPWTDKGRPRTGDRVEVFSGRSGANTRVFTGMVDTAPGSFADPSFSSAVVDDIDRLNRTVSWDALALAMPPWDSNSATSYKRMTGITGVYVTDRCLRAGGFNATPPRDINSVVSAPLMGSTWPEQGALMDSCRVVDIGKADRLSPRWTSSRWGVSTFDAYAEYMPFLGTLPGTITADTPLNITLMSGVSANLSASGHVMAYMGDGTILRLAVTSSRSLVGQVIQSGVTTSVVTMTQGQAGGEWSAATLRIYPSGTGWEWQIKTNLSDKGGATHVATTGVLTTSALSTVRVRAPEGTLMGGAQVSFAPLTRGSACLYVQTARVSVGRIWYLNALPAVTSTPAVDILKAQAEAEWAGLWIDEDGVAQWRDVDRMLSATVALDLTSDDSLKDVAFRFDSQDVRRKAIIKYTGMTVSTTKQHRLVGHEGGRDELAPGDSQDVWITPEQGAHWIDPDTNPLEVYGQHGGTTVNRGVGTLQGFTGLDANGEETAVIDPTTGARKGTWAITLEKVGQSFHYTSAVSALDASIDRVRTTTKINGTGAYRNVGLPVIRVRGIVTEVEQEYVSASTGPAWAADYEHPGLWFVQHADQAKDIGDRIAHKINTPQPVVESVQIVPDPRIQLGDKVRVVDRAVTGVTVTGVVTGVSQNMDTGEPTMSLRLIVTEVTTPNVTIREFEAWYSGMTIAQVEAVFAGETITQVEGKPLR